MRSRIFLLIFSLSFLPTLLSAQDNAKLERQINHLWEYSVKTFRSPRSGLFYGKALHELPPLKSYPTREQYRRGEYRTQGYKKGDEKTVGYNLHGGGSGTEDCALFTGTLLGAMCDKYTATGDPSCRTQARMAYEGLRSAATAHGEPGFIARGVSPEDGKTIFAGTSRDQYTNAVYGFWRYYTSPLSSEQEKAEIRSILCAVADKMRREITPENNYSFRFAYGLPDDRGVAKMDSPTPSYVTLRLAMIYAAAWEVSGDKTYYGLFLKSLENGLTGTEKWIEESRKATSRYTHSPAYVVLQQAHALELTAKTVRDSARKQRILEVFRAVNRFADESPVYAGARFRDLAEIVGGQLKLPGWKLSAKRQDDLRRDIMRLGSKGWPGANYTLIGAYWAARAAGYFTPEKTTPSPK